MSSAKPICCSIEWHLPPRRQFLIPYEAKANDKNGPGYVRRCKVEEKVNFHSIYSLRIGWQKVNENEEHKARWQSSRKDMHDSSKFLLVVETVKKLVMSLTLAYAYISTRAPIPTNTHAAFFIVYCAHTGTTTSGDSSEYSIFVQPWLKCHVSSCVHVQYSYSVGA